MITLLCSTPISRTTFTLIDSKFTVTAQHPPFMSTDWTFCGLSNTSADICVVGFSTMQTKCLRQSSKRPMNVRAPAKFHADGTVEIEVPDEPKPRRPQRTCQQQNPATKAAVPELARAARGRRQLVTSASNNHCSGARADSKNWCSVELKDDPLIEAFEHNVTLLFSNVATRLCYMKNLSTLRRLCGGKAIRDLVIPSPAPMLNTLMHAAHKHNITANTIKNMLTALLCLCRNVLSDRSKAKPEVQQALVALKHAHKQAKRAANTRANAVAGWVSYVELCEARDALPASSQARLFMEVMTAWPKLDGLHSCELVTVERAHAPTQLVLPGKGEDSAVLTYTHANEDKPHRVTLSKMVTAALEASLKHEPRQYLFAFKSQAAFRPYNSQASFDKWACKVLKNACNPSATLAKARKAVAAHHVSNGGNPSTMALAMGLPLQSLRKQCRQTVLLLQRRDEMRLKRLKKNSTAS